MRPSPAIRRCSPSRSANGRRAPKRRPTPSASPSSATTADTRRWSPRAATRVPARATATDTRRWLRPATKCVLLLLLLLHHGLTYRRHAMSQSGFAQMMVPSIEAFKKLFIIKSKWSATKCATSFSIFLFPLICRVPWLRPLGHPSVVDVVVVPWFDLSST